MPVKAYSVRYYYKHKREHVCVRCGKTLKELYTHCKTCREKIYDNAGTGKSRYTMYLEGKKRYKYRRKNQLCLICGDLIESKDYCGK